MRLFCDDMIKNEDKYFYRCKRKCRRPAIKLFFCISILYIDNGIDTSSWAALKKQKPTNIEAMVSTSLIL